MAYQHYIVLERATDTLREAKEMVAAEIANYPTPISGCDAQFNHLLSERAKIASALHALASAPFIPTSRQLEPVSASY